MHRSDWEGTVSGVSVLESLENQDHSQLSVLRSEVVSLQKDQFVVGPVLLNKDFVQDLHHHRIRPPSHPDREYTGVARE